MTTSRVMAIFDCESVEQFLGRAKAGHVGPVDVATERLLDTVCGLKLEVTVDGEVVTDRCYFADDKAGIVRLLKHDEQGRCYYDPETDDAAKEERRGIVRFVVSQRAAA